MRQTPQNTLQKATFPIGQPASRYARGVIPAAEAPVFRGLAFRQIDD
jgi:hypothetical protein